MDIEQNTLKVALPTQHSDAPASPNPRPQGRTYCGWRLPALLWVVFLTLLALAGFLMASYATSRARRNTVDQQILTSAILVADLQHLDQYPGFNLVTNLFRGTGYWASRPDMPYYRSDMAVVTSPDHKAIIAGGISDNATNPGAPIILNKVVSYDALYNVTTNLTDMPRPRTRCGFVALNNKMYLFGGFDDANQNVTIGHMDVYDLTTNKWEVNPTAALNVKRSDSCQGVLNGKIYVAGGYGVDGNSLSSIEEYDPATNKWTLRQETLLTPRGDCEGVVSNGSLYFMGGATNDPNCKPNPPEAWWKCYTFTSSVEKMTLNPDGTATIKYVAPMLYPRGDFGAYEVYPGRILVAGGETADTNLGVYRQLAVPWVEEYDVNDDHWTPKAPMPEASFRFVMTEAGNQLLAFGGHPSCAMMQQDDPTRCDKNGLKNVRAFSDVYYPSVYMLARETVPTGVVQEL